MAASINPISTSMSLELNAGMVDGKQVLLHNTVSKLDNEVTPAAMASLQTILAAFLEYPVAETKVRTTGLLVE
jgi:hypothetical protein